MDQALMLLFGLCGCVGAIALFAGLVVVISQEFSRRRTDFEQRFPPISDDEYLALFEPGTNSDIA